MCSGDQLELMCIGSSLLEWTITPTNSMGFQRAIAADTPSDQTSYFMVNSSLFTLSRTSAKDRLPLESRIFINPVTSDINGTVVVCTDGIATMEKASAILSVMSRLQDGMFFWITIYSVPTQCHYTLYTPDN